MEELESSLSVQDTHSTYSRSLCNTPLARKRSTKKPRGALSVKVHAKHKASMKSKLPGTYIRKRKQKKKDTECQSYQKPKVYPLGENLFP